MVHSTSRALESVWGEKRKIRRGVLGAFLMKKTKCVEGGGRNLVRDGMCASLKQLAETLGRA